MFTPAEIYWIAVAARVTPPTVVSYLSGRRRTRPANVARIRAAIEELRARKAAES